MNQGTVYVADRGLLHFLYQFSGVIFKALGRIPESQIIIDSTCYSYMKEQKLEECRRLLAEDLPPQLHEFQNMVPEEQRGLDMEANRLWKSLSLEACGILHSLVKALLQVEPGDGKLENPLDDLPPLSWFKFTESSPVLDIPACRLNAKLSLRNVYAMVQGVFFLKAHPVHQDMLLVAYQDPVHYLLTYAEHQLDHTEEQIRMVPLPGDAEAWARWYTSSSGCFYKSFSTEVLYVVMGCLQQNADVMRSINADYFV